jgi:hypothetical protein
MDICFEYCVCHKTICHFESIDRVNKVYVLCHEVHH